MSKPKSKSDCHCGCGREFERCCGPLLQGEQAAGGAESLMRSRYTAYVLGAGAYLLQTWHPQTRPANLDTHDPTVKWLGLNVLQCVGGLPGDTDGEVVFVARYKINGKAHTMREHSLFRFENGRWFYYGAKRHE